MMAETDSLELDPNDSNELHEVRLDLESGEKARPRAVFAESKKEGFLNQARSIVVGFFSEGREVDFQLEEEDEDEEPRGKESCEANGDVFQRRAFRSEDGPRTYSAKFFVEFEGTSAELKIDPVAKLEGAALERLLTPRSPDPEGPASYWKDLYGDVGEKREEKAKRLMFLGASILSFSSGLPFSSRLACESSKILNGLAFLDGEEGMILMPSCASRESEQVLLDNRNLIKNDGEWKTLVLSYAKWARDCGIISRKAGETNEWTVVPDSPLSKELADLDLERGGVWAETDSQTIGEIVQRRVKRELGLDFLREACKDGISFGLKPSRKGGWDSLSDGEEGSSVRHEISAEIELYYSYA